MTGIVQNINIYTYIYIATFVCHGKDNGNSMHTKNNPEQATKQVGICVKNNNNENKNETKREKRKRKSGENKATSWETV